MQTNKRFIFLLSITIATVPTFLTSHATTPPQATTPPIGAVSEVTTEDGLHGALTSSTPTVVMGYMHNCTHCNALKPDFTMLAKKYPKINFILANGPNLIMHKRVAQLTDNAIKIPGYPTVVFINPAASPHQITDSLIGGNRQKLISKVEALAAATKSIAKSKGVTSKSNK